MAVWTNNTWHNWNFIFYFFDQKVKIFFTWKRISPIPRACEKIYVLPVSFRCTMTLGWCARSELSERLRQVNLLETQKSRATNGEMSLGCHVFSCVHHFPDAACARFDRLIHKFLMNTRLIRLCVCPYAAHVPICVCVRARTQPTAGKQFRFVPVILIHASICIILHWNGLHSWLASFLPDFEAGKLLWSDSGCVSCVCHPVMSFQVSTDEFISLLSKQTSISEFSFFTRQ